MPNPTTFQYYIDSNGQAWTLNVNPDGTLTTTVFSGSTTIPSGGIYTTQAGAIISAASQDIQQRVVNPLAQLDYVNRVVQRILRESQWQFLLSQPQKFVTQPGATQYWIGSGTTPAGTFNTGLNIANLWSIPNEHVFDASNWKQLMPDSAAALVSPAYTYQDGSPRWDRPRTFYYDIGNPGVLNIFPAPDNQNIYQPVPLPPLCTTVTGGALPNRVYYVSATFVDTEGNESTPPNQTTVIFIPAGQLLVVSPPAPEVASATSITYNRFKVYASQAIQQPPLTSSANITQQTSTPQTTAWTEPTSGLTTTGPLPPGASSITPLYGYVIEFRYFVQRAIVAGMSDILQIPDIYKDVVIAGVNWFVSMYSNNSHDADRDRAIIWKQEFLDGIRQIRKDLNINFRRTDYIAPDAVSQYQYGNKLDYPSLGI